MEERARRIVETAIELAEKGGFEAVRLRDVAAHSGVALGTLYRHFRSKEELLLGALADQIAQLERLLESMPTLGPTPLQRVTTLFTMATRAMCLRPMLARAVIKAAASGTPEPALKVASFHGSILAMVVAAMRDSHKPVSDPSKDEADVAELLEFVWFSSLVGWAAGLHNEDYVNDRVRTAATLMMAALEKAD